MQAAKSALHVVSWIMQRATFFLLIGLAIAAVAATLMAAFGAAAFLTWPLSFGETLYPDAGMYIQIGLTALLVGLCFFLPGHDRISKLETSHRLFTIGMRDVAHAYALAHAADREGVFQMSGEFDSVRERLMYLRDHPDLGQLEPTILEVAAQMSHISADLAKVYSDEKVARARHVLEQRQQEIEEFNFRIDKAKHVATEMRNWVSQVELEESVARAQLERLTDDLADVLPAMGLDLVSKEAEVVTLPHAAE